MHQATAWLKHKQQQQMPWTVKQMLWAGVYGVCLLISIIVPAIPLAFISLENWKGSAAPQVHEFLAAQPTATLVASLAQEADNIPAFAERSTLVGEEFALAYHPKYYAVMEQRATELIEAQYSADLAAAKAMIQQYGIDYFLIESTAFDPTYLLSRKWFMHSSFTPTVMEAIARLQQGTIPALAQLSPDCTALAVDTFRLLNADCILEQSSPQF
ncbi:MAG: hypothetical protein HC881_20175 [Leptolyngbyaceae cyanobacterium SL_7_1]|nr:hypothetical protein [Leptolyngbyaceae cyanobacterium SL_7_1]